MQQVIVDQATQARLHNLAELLEVCDEHGRVLGYFAPLRKLDRSLYEGAEVPVTAEDVKRLLQQPRGRPLADIFRDLEQRS